MNIIEKTYTLNGELKVRSKTNRIILHHAAATNCTAEDVDRWHKGNGWTCIGYHFFVDKEGNVYRGRPENTVGAHASNNNSDSIGICAEGNFENEAMPEAQKQALKELVAYLKNKYGISKVQGHKDVNATACPGKNYPFNEIANSVPQETPVVNEKAQVIKNLQHAYNVSYKAGLVEDGIKGVKTEAAMKKYPVRNYTANALAKWVQDRLINHKGYGLKYGADGKYGAETEKVVKQFQRDNKLVVDGIAGYNTINILI